MEKRFKTLKVLFCSGNLTNETVIAQIGCVGKTIVEFTTSSPIGLIKSAIMNPSTGTIIVTTRSFLQFDLVFLHRYLHYYTSIYTN